MLKTETGVVVLRAALSRMNELALIAVVTVGPESASLEFLGRRGVRRRRMLRVFILVGHHVVAQLAFERLRASVLVELIRMRRIVVILRKVVQHPDVIRVRRTVISRFVVVVHHDDELETSNEHH